jgi:hypothetical protein
MSEQAIKLCIIRSVGGRKGLPESDIHNRRAGAAGPNVLIRGMVV